MIAASIVIGLIQEAGQRAGIENPFYFFRNAINDRANFKLSDAWFGMMYCDNALLAIAFVCYTVTLLLRRKNGSLWFCRVVDSQGGGLITPNTTNIFAVLSMVYSVFGCTSKTLQILAYKDIGRSDAYQFFNAVAGPITVLAIVSELHGICIFLLLGLSPLASKLLQIHPRSALIFNVSFGLLYFFVAASIGIPYIVSSYYFTQGMNAVRKLTDAITVSAQAWQPGEPFRFDPAWIDAITDLSVWGPYTKANKAANQCFLAMLIIIVLIFLPVSALYAQTLRDQINGLDEFSASSQSRQIRKLRSSYHLIAGEMILVLLAAIGYCVLVSLWTYNYDSIVSDMQATGLVLGVRSSIYPWLSFFVSITLLARALLGRKDEGKAGSVQQTASGSSGTSGTSKATAPPLHIRMPSLYSGPSSEKADDDKETETLG